MKTKQLTFDEIDMAATLLQQGEAVIMPTDTVYGVGVNPFDAEAIDRLYAIKERPGEKGIPILLSDAGQMSRVTNCEPSPRLKRLINQFWPGPLTVIVSKKADLPSNLSSNDGIAVRVPDHPQTQQLIAKAGGALAVSSANISGEPPATSAESALNMLAGRVAAVIGDSKLPGALPSTIIDCRTEEFKILREGPLSADVLFR